MSSTESQLNDVSNEEKSITVNTDNGFSAYNEFEEMLNEISENTGIKLEIGQYGYLQATFYSISKIHSIVVEIDLERHEVLINTMNIKSEAPTELVILLKKMVFELKKLNIAYVVQQVTRVDWITIIKPFGLFKFINENKEKDFVTIRCNIDRFPEAVMKALGFNDINNQKY